MNRQIACNLLIQRTQGHAVVISMGDSEANYTHARLLEEGWGSRAEWSQSTTEKNHVELDVRQIYDDNEDAEENNGEKHIDGDYMQGHPRVRIQSKWAVFSR
jgi:hypothetical protein